MSRKDETVITTWAQLFPGESNVRHMIETALGSHLIKEYNVDQIEERYRELLNAKLAAAEITLDGNGQFIGPVGDECTACTEHYAPLFIREACQAGNEQFWSVAISCSEN